MNTAQEILAQLDRCAEEFTFPMLDNGYVYHGATRLSVFRDDINWLMIIEVLGANSPRTCGLDSFQNCLHLFGSALHRPPGTANEDFLYPLSDLPKDPLFADPFDWFARPEAKSLMIREKLVALDFSTERLTTKGIVLLDPPKKDPPAILRSLLPEYRDLLLATEDELKLRNPLGLALWLRLDDWHHPDLAGDELPSQSETFRMLADAIATGDKSKYQPIRTPNTHWQCWPAGGTL